MRGYQAGDKIRTDRERRSVLQQLADGNGTPNFSTGATQLARAGDLEGAGALARLAQLNTRDVPSSVREYEYGLKNPAYREYQIGLRQAGATKVNNAVSLGENEYQKTLGKSDAETFVGLQKSGQASTGTIATLERMKALTNAPGFYSGRGAERFVLPTKQLVVALGGKGDSAAPMEEFRALSNKAALDGMGGSLGAGFSNADRDFVISQYPNLDNTPDGNRMRIEGAIAIERRKGEIAKRAREYAARNNGRLDARFFDDLSYWAEKNPLFPEAGQGGTPSRAAPAANGAPQRINSQQEYNALSSGSQFIAPDGNLRRKP